MNNKYKVYSLLLVILCMVLTSNMISYAKNDGNKEKNSNDKRILVKYKDNSKNVDNSINSRKKDGSFIKHNKINNTKVYSFEIDKNHMESFLNDKDIEIVEDDTIIQLLSESSMDNCCKHFNNIHDDRKGSCSIELCGDCTELNCNDSQENNCSECSNIVDVIDEDYIFPEPDNGEQDPANFWMDYEPCCEKHSYMCLITGACCDNCIFNDIFLGKFEIFKDGIYTPPQLDPLPNDNKAMSTLLGDKITWNILRTGADKLQEINITGSGIKVAVFDTGISLNNSELKVVGGVSFVDGVSSYDDDHGHGTAMAGIISAGLDGKGIVGMAPDALLYSVKILDKNGYGRYSGILQGIQWAIENDMDIISLSLGGFQYSQILKEAIDQAVANNILVIAASGNSDSGQVMYPAAYSQVVCVGATTSENTRAIYSNYGSQIDISAPGSEIETIGIDGTTKIVSGTSPAAAHVTGAAALLWSQKGDLTNGHIKYLLFHNAYDLNNYNLFGHGLIDVVKAYDNLQNEDYTVYISTGDDEGYFLDNTIGEGWDGIIYAQACSHVFDTCIKTVNPTCTKSGYSVWQCYKCNATTNHTIGALGHNYVRTSSMAPTCTKDGFATYTCSRCSASYTNTLAALGHNYQTTGTTAPTCTAKGYTSYKCSRCSSTKNDNYVNALGHNYKTTTISPTCTQDGNSKDVCSRCGNTTNNIIIEKLGHNWQITSTIEPTCQSQGSKTSTCNRCKITKTDQIPTVAHSYISYNTPANCTNNGESGLRCTQCGRTTNVSIILATGHNNSYYLSSTHNSNGHYYENYCTRCSNVSSSGYTTQSSCLSCTTPPSVSFYNINGNTVLNENQTNHIIQIQVIDNENDSLMCNYYLDGSTSSSSSITATNTRGGAIVSFPIGINAAALSEGNHNIKATVKDTISPLGQANITFKVDKSAPIISTIAVEPTTSTVKLTVTASDTISGLAPLAYRYTINNIVSEWITSNTYIRSDLVVNTNYSYAVEVRDNVGHSIISRGNFNTKLDKPNVTVNSLPCESIRIIIKDNNPVGTSYLVKVGNSYANGSGGITGNQLWIQPAYDNTYGGKLLVLNNLQSGTQYNIVATARNNANTEQVTGNSVVVNTTPTAPNSLRVTDITSSYISLVWNAIEGASTYDLLRDTLSNDGIVTSSKNINSITGTFYQDRDVVPGGNYRYTIRSVDQSNNFGSWSVESKNATAKPLPPEKVQNVEVEVNGSVITITWGNINGAVGYEVELISNGNVISSRSKEPIYTTDTRCFSSQCDVKVRAFNLCDNENKDDPTFWSNEGSWSDITTSYTHADIPVLNEIKEEDISADSVRVYWEKGQNPMSVEYKLIVLENGQPVKETIFANILEYRITGLKANTIYAFQVKARNINLIETEWSNIVTGKTLINVPKTPDKLRAIAKDEGIVLSWEASEGAQSYRVTRNGLVIADDLKELSYIDTMVTPEEVYTYAVQAINNYGESEYSLLLTKKALGEIPKAPEIKVVSGGSISITINWNSVENVTGYELDIDGKVKNLGMETVFEHVGLLPGTDHTYRVRARNTYGKSKWSTPLVVQTDNVTPLTPAIITATSLNNQIYISWSNTDYTDYYEIKVNELVISNLNSSEYILTLEEGATLQHEIKVRSVNSCGNSEWSGIVSIIRNNGEGEMPQIRIPDMPVLHANPGYSNVSLNWDGSNEATFYQLEVDNIIIYEGPANKYNHRALEGGSTHSYRIRAGNIGGFSEWSAPIIVNVKIMINIPSNINYFRLSESKTLLTWEAVNGLNNYVVDINGVISEPTDKTNIEIDTEPGEVYRIKIAVLSKDTEGMDYYDWSDEISFTAARGLPKAPEIKETKAGYDSIEIVLIAEEEASGYEVDISGILMDVGNNLNVVQTGLLPSESYDVRVRSYNEAGVGEWSKISTIMTGETLPGVPLNIIVENSSPSVAATGSAITISWDKVEGATGYQISDENGITFETTENYIKIENLSPGIPHYFSIRTVKGEGFGPWSNLIRVIPILYEPDNIGIEVKENVVRVYWSNIGGATHYTVEIDGIIVGTTTESFMDFPYHLFHVERGIRIRACQNELNGNWSDVLVFNSALPVKFSIDIGEEFSCLLPVQNVSNIGKYKLSLTYNNNELELIDACELTIKKEITSGYIHEIHTSMIVISDGNQSTIVFILDGKEGSNFTGNAGSIRFKSKVSTEVTLIYGVTLK